MNSDKTLKTKSDSFSSDSTEIYNTVSSQKSFFSNSNNDTINMPTTFHHGQIAFDDGLQRLRQARHL
jgi:hypothetical protein